MNQLLLSSVMPEMEGTVTGEMYAVARVPRALAIRAASIQDVQPLPFIAYATELAAKAAAIVSFSFVNFATDGSAASTAAFVFTENGDA